MVRLAHHNGSTSSPYIVPGSVVIKIVGKQSLAGESFGYAQDKLLIRGYGAGTAAAQSPGKILDGAGGSAAGIGGYRGARQVVLVDMMGTLIVNVQDLSRPPG